MTRDLARAMRRWQLGLGVAWMSLALLTSACAPTPAGTRRLSIATGGTGGVYYVYGGAMARVLSRYLDGVEVSAEVTAASAENVELLHQGSADLAFCLADTAADAYRGEGRFAAPRGIRLLAVLYDNATHLVVRADASLSRIADLRGRRVSLGSPNSGTELIAERTLRAAGLDPARDLDRERLGAGESADALRDGRIDAFFWSGGLPTAAVLELAYAPGAGIRLIDTAEVLPRLHAAHGALYREARVPAGTYGDQPEIAVSVVASLLIASSDLDEALVADILATLFEHRDDLVAAHPAAKALSLEAARQPGPLPLHPGAERFYREAVATPSPASAP